MDENVYGEWQMPAKFIIANDGMEDRVFRWDPIEQKYVENQVAAHDEAELRWEDVEQEDTSCEGWPNFWPSARSAHQAKPEEER